MMALNNVTYRKHILDSVNSTSSLPKLARLQFQADLSI